MNTKVKIPTVKYEVSPERSFFSIESLDKKGWFVDKFEFSVTKDGSVTINDNEFDSKKQAIQVLEAMLAFLKK